MTLVTLPFRSQLAGGQVEDIGNVLANFDAILAVVNGGLQNDNLASDAAIPYSKLVLAGQILPTDLADPGSNGLYLQRSGGSVQWLSTSPQASIYRKTTPTAIDTTTSPTDLTAGAITVGAGVMSTDKVLQFWFRGDWKQNAGGVAVPPRFQLILGPATLLDTNALAGGAIASNSVNRFGWELSGMIANLGAANLQWASMSGSVAMANSTPTSPVAFAVGEGVINTAYSGDGAYTALMLIEGGGPGTVDTTAPQALLLKVINGSASATYQTVLKHALVTVT